MITAFLFGILETVLFRKPKKTVSEIITNGFLIMLALFLITAVPLIRLEQPLSVLAKSFMLMVFAADIAAVVLGRKQIYTAWREIRVFWSKRDSRYLLFAVILFSMVVSIGFTRPGAEDATTEIVRTSLATDTMYVYDAYTGYASDFVSQGHVYSPIEMLYAAGSDATGIQGNRFVYYVLPAVLLPIFFTGIWRLGKELLKEEKQVIRFELFVTSIYWMSTYVEGRTLVMGVFLNSWNGLTLLSCVVMPLAFSMILQWLKEGTGRAEKMFFAVVLPLAGQLTNDKGGFYIVLMLVSGTAVKAVRRGYAYVAASGGFKKRI